MKIIDCCGLNCPEPVLRTKNALSENPGIDISVTVDNETARENVLRFARNQGRKAEWKENKGLFSISISAGDEDETQEIQGTVTTGPGDRPVLFFANDELGSGSRELGEMLMRNFIYTLTKRETLPQALVFMNSGVKLCVEGSAAIEELQFFKNKDITILVCGTCLDYYELKDKLRVGEVSNMYDIADLLLDAERVFTV